MKSPVAPSPFHIRAGRSLTFAFVIAVLPLLGACQGNLDNGIKQISEGSGGDSGAGSGGSSSSGGTTGSGGTSSSGGTTGSGGVVGSSGGTVGSGGAVSSGGAQGSGTGGKSGSGGMTAAGGSKGSGGSAGGAMGSGSGGSGTMACDAPTKIFKDATVGCIDSGCHAKGAGNQGPDLQTADPTTLKAYKTKVLCSGTALVVPSDPTSSVLWKVVDGRTCGDLMPLGKQPLSQDQEDCLAAWIGSL